MSRTVLVTGATGKQGGAAVDAFLAHKSANITVRALTRKPDSASAKALAAKGVELAKGSLDDKNSLVKALQGVSAAFLVTSPGGPGGAKAEEKEGKTFIDAAKEVKLGHLVFSSVEGADRKTGIPHFDSKWAIEEYLRASGIQHTILRPVAFYDNFPKHTGLSSFFLFGVFEAALCGKKLQFVACSDIGQFAAKALEDPRKYAGRTIGLAGDYLTMSEIQDAYQATQGYRPYKAYLPSLVIYFAPYDFKKMLWWFYEEGFKVDISALKKEHAELLTFEQWLKSE